MTALQRSMILASLAAPREGLYLIQDVCELPGSTNIAVLRDAWRAVVRRHPAMRRAVDFAQGMPAGFLPDSDAAEYWRDESACTIDPLLRHDRALGFEFGSSAPIRVTTLREPNSLTVIWTIHHALLDGRSMTLVWQEWLAGYDALIQGRHLPDQPASEDSAESPLSPDAERFWREYLRGLSHSTDYIIERIPSQGDGLGEREKLSLTEDLTSRLRDLAALHGVTINTLVQGAWAVLLSRCSGRRDIVFGVTRSGRATPDDARSVGFYINTLPLRVAVDAQATLGPWLQQLRSTWLALREVEHTPLSQAAEWGGLPAGQTPFESLLNYDHETPGDTLGNRGSLRRLQRTDSTLTLAAFGSPVLTLELIFDTRRYSHRTMAAAVRHLGAILESFTVQPAPRLGGLNILTEEDRAVLLRGATPMDVPEVCAHNLFALQAERTPTHVAIEAGDGCITYADLNARANLLASQLEAAGVNPRDLVAVCMEASPESVIAILAILKAGGAFLPVAPDLPEDRRQAILADARPVLLLSSATPPAAAGGRTEDTEDRITPDDLAYVIYTSGSTGQPKAVAMPHRALVNHSLAASGVYGISDTDRRLQMASIGADFFIAEVFNYLCRGATLVFGWDRRNRSVREFLQVLDQRRITVTGMPTGWWREWMAAAEHSDVPLPASLRAVVIGMEKAEAADFAKWKRLAGTRIRLFNAYGPTEASPTTTIYEAGSSPWEGDTYVPIGKPLANTSVYVLDDQATPVPIGVAGELYIGGAGLARGYWNRPDLTAERFVQCYDNARLYRTGDVVFALPDGNLVFVGRADRQVKIRGFRVELDEIETVLAGHPEVQACAVVLTAEGERPVLAAFVSFRDGGPSPEVLRSYLARRLPDYMIPAAFVTLPALPLTPSGKIDRQALPLSQLQLVRPEQGIETLSTESERLLAELWRQVLDVWPIGASDNFFDLGADSLHATRLLALIEQHFRILVPAALLSRVPTLARMAFTLEQREIPADLKEEPGAVVPLQANGSRIPFFCFPGNESAAFFLPLAVSLGDRQPFYSVHDPRPYRERGSYTVEQAAERLVEAIRQVQKTGPYIIGGHCFGGFVAFEAARRLTALGETVAKVILMDVGAPGYPNVVRNWRDYFRFATIVLRGRRRITLREVRGHLGALARSLQNRFGTRRPQLPVPVPASQPAEAPPARHPNVQAGLDYDPTPFACDLVNILAADGHHSPDILYDPRLRWKDLAKGSFTALPIAGKAEDLYRPPHVRELAARIQSVLDDVN
ncbi:MAG: amino acid adenylation domain-containing protein [Bryobacteraceae bacterium]